MVTEFLIHKIMHSFTLQFDFNLNHITDMLAAATTEVKPEVIRQTTDNCYCWRNKCKRGLRSSFQAIVP